MNRKQKRDIFKAAKHHQDGLWCPDCGHRSFISAQKVGGDIDHYDTFCVVCKSYRGRLRLMPNQIDPNGMIFGHLLDQPKRLIVEVKPNGA